MKSLDRIPLLANVLIVACARPNAEVGKLMKAVVSYITDGIKPTLDDPRLEAYFDLLVQDLDSQKSAAEVKSRKCSESAKCRNAKNAGSSANGSNATSASNSANPSTSARRNNSVNVANATKTTEAVNTIQSEKQENKADATTVSDATNVDNADSTSKVDEVANENTEDVPNESKPVPDFNASDATSSFGRMKVTYGKAGDNESQAFGVWQQLGESERMAAFAHAQRMQGDLTSRSYLYVYLRDREWTKVVSPGKA